MVVLGHLLFLEQWGSCICRYCWAIWRPWQKKEGHEHDGSTGSSGTPSKTDGRVHTSSAGSPVIPGKTKGHICAGTAGTSAVPVKKSRSRTHWECWVTYQQFTCPCLSFLEELHVIFRSQAIKERLSSHVVGFAVLAVFFPQLGCQLQLLLASQANLLHLLLLLFTLHLSSNRTAECKNSRQIFVNIKHTFFFLSAQCLYR